MTAAASKAIQVQAHKGSLGVESFDAHRSAGDAPVARLRLTASEARWLRYVFGEWDGECGAGSSFGVQLEKLAQKPRHASTAYHEARRRDIRAAGGDTCAADAAREAQTIYVHAAEPTAYERVWPAEAWADKRHDDKEAILRCWRAVGLCEFVHQRVLRAIYGDRPPGMPGEGLWHRSTDEEYRRVCRIATGGVVELSATSRKRAVGENDAAWKARVSGETADRAEHLRAVGATCDRAIVAASLAYRAAWRVA
ncbi:MAG TPA: hypothetical protein VIY73_13360 [Polyangiaceae bacterium]